MFELQIVIILKIVGKLRITEFFDSLFKDNELFANCNLLLNFFNFYLFLQKLLNSATNFTENR